MHAQSTTRRRPLFAAAVLVSSCAAGVLTAQIQPAGSSLPATTPTAMPAPLAATMSSAPVAKKPQKPTVTYSGGMLNVRANDSSLNSILREIARLTSMTVSGGVADQRVFGNYGPAEPSVMIATLLDGTGTNIFLKEASAGSPAELILTPRSGGVTPPSPGSAQYADNDEPASQRPAQPLQNLPYDSRPGYAQMPPSATQQMPARPFANPNDGGLTGPVPMAPPINNPLGDPNTVSPTASSFPVTNSVPTDSLPTPSTAQSVSGIVDAPASPAMDSNTANITAAAQADANSSTTPVGTAPAGIAPAGAVTAEQIFQQLQALRRAAAAQNGTGSANTTTTAPAATPQPTTNPQ